MVLMRSQVWEPLIKKPSSQEPDEGGIQNHTGEKETNDLYVGMSWFHNEKQHKHEIKNRAPIHELTQKVFRFPFFFDEYDSYDGAGYKKKSTGRRALRLPSVKWSPFASALWVGSFALELA